MGIEGFQCDVCGALFTTPSSLEGHRKKHPHMQCDRRHRCHLCSYSTDVTSNLRSHLLTHSGERPHQCTHCHRAFTEKRNLSRHLLIHTGERPHLCTTCGRTFSRLDYLRTHERIHDGVRFHRCPTCGRDFSQACNLKKHQRIHIQQWPSSVLSKHIVSKHTLEYIYTCSQCEMGFMRPSELRKHMDRQHSCNKTEDKLTACSIQW